MALTKSGFKTKNWSHLVGDQTVERERREKERRRRGRGRERKEIKQAKIKGMELTLDMDHMNFVWNSRKVYEFQT